MNNWQFASTDGSLSRKGDESRDDIKNRWRKDGFFRPVGKVIEREVI